MPVNEALLPDPILDDRNEADRIAARIHRSVNNPTDGDAQLWIDAGEALRALLEANGGPADQPLLSELSSASPAEAHIVLLREIERASTETLFRFNQLPDKNRIGFLRLLGISLLPAVAASTTLRFTKTDDYLNIEVTIPEGVEVTDEDRSVRVSTVEDLVIPSGTASATVQAKASDTGDIRLNTNTLGINLQSLAGIANVTNTTALTGGADGETVEQGKIRAREEMRIGQHLGSADDYVDYLYRRVLSRKGRVTAFERYLSDFSRSSLGYMLLVIQGADGLAPSQATIEAASAVISQRHVGGLYVTARGPLFKSFDLSIQVSIARGQSAATLINKAKANLQAFYHPLKFAYGPEFSRNDGSPYSTRYISLSDIVGQVEAAAPSLISVGTSANRFAITITVGGVDIQADVPLLIGELTLPRSVSMTVL